MESMGYLITSMLIIIALNACNETEETLDKEASTVCGFSDPLKTLPWLKQNYDNIKNIPESGIIVYMYQDKEVIEIQSSLMSSTNLSQYLCDGTKLQFDTPETYENDYLHFLNHRIKLKILYGKDLWNL
jgi:hypothetical protein